MAPKLKNKPLSHEDWKAYEARAVAAKEESAREAAKVANSLERLKAAALMIPMVNSIKRLKAYTLSGEQVCMAGLGSEDTFGTFPGGWEVGNLLNTTGWIKVLGCPGDGETPKAGAHYELLDNTWRPKTVLLNCDSGAIVGTPNESISAYGATHLTVLSTEAHIPFEEKPCADVDEVPTPPTPPRPSSIQAGSIWDPSFD